VRSAECVKDSFRNAATACPRQRTVFVSEGILVPVNELRKGKDAAAERLCSTFQACRSARLLFRRSARGFASGHEGATTSIAGIRVGGRLCARSLHACVGCCLPGPLFVFARVIVLYSFLQFCRSEEMNFLQSHRGFQQIREALPGFQWVPTAGGGGIVAVHRPARLDATLGGR